jgi:hypothetical protein
MTYVFKWLLRADRRRMDIKKKVVVQVARCVYILIDESSVILMALRRRDECTPVCRMQGCTDRIGQQNRKFGQLSNPEQATSILSIGIRGKVFPPPPFNCPSWTVDSTIRRGGLGVPCKCSNNSTSRVSLSSIPEREASTKRTNWANKFTTEL